MLYHDNGSCYSVTVTRAEVEAFKAIWPCSELPDRAIWFQFDKASGDLVDLGPRYVDGAAVVALSQDAQTYGLSRQKAS